MKKNCNSGVNISIKFDSSYKANLIINGRKLEIVLQGGVWKLLGVEPSEIDGTLGGMIASSLMDKLIDILQAWMPDSMPDRPPEVWEKLSEEAADEIYDKIG